jgi:hypothetical protein
VSSPANASAVSRTPSPPGEQGPVDPKGSTLSDTLVVAAATLGGYAVAFAYEVGYTKYFGIPRQLIAIGLTAC